MDLGIAIPLPTDGKNGPIILALLVFIGLVLPMGLAAWFLFSSSKYMGPNQIMQDTLNIFLRHAFLTFGRALKKRYPRVVVCSQVSLCQALFGVHMVLHRVGQKEDTVVSFVGHTTFCIRPVKICGVEKDNV